MPTCCPPPKVGIGMRTKRLFIHACSLGTQHLLYISTWRICIYFLFLQNIYYVLGFIWQVGRCTIILVNDIFWTTTWMGGGTYVSMEICDLESSMMCSSFILNSTIGSPITLSNCVCTLGGAGGIGQILFGILFHLILQQNTALINPGSKNQVEQCTDIIRMEWFMTIK